MSKLILKNGPIATAIKRIEIRCLRFDVTNDITAVSDVNLTKKARTVDKNLQSKIKNLKSVFSEFSK